MVPWKIGSRKQVVRMGAGWNQLGIMFTDGLWYN